MATLGVTAPKPEVVSEPAAEAPVLARPEPAIVVQPNQEIEIDAQVATEEPGVVAQADATMEEPIVDGSAQVSEAALQRDGPLPPLQPATHGANAIQR